MKKKTKVDQVKKEVQEEVKEEQSQEEQIQYQISLLQNQGVFHYSLLNNLSILIEAVNQLVETQKGIGKTLVNIGQILDEQGEEDVE